jgi:hypothetical protein
MVWTWLLQWKWLILSIFTGVPTVYYGPKKALETWDWYINRFFDEPVMEIIKDRRFHHYENRREEEPYTVGDLAKRLKRTHLSIGKSIRRLKRQDRIELYMGGFRPKS